MKTKVSIFWFRRDLRLSDNSGLHQALNAGYPVLPIFIFDPTILQELADPYDRRVDYIHQALSTINEQLKKRGTSLLTYYDRPQSVFASLITEFDIQEVFANRDYEPQAIRRDQEVESLLAEQQIPLHLQKDQVLFERHEILKSDGSPYTVFTPYANKWRAKLAQTPVSHFDSFTASGNFLPQRNIPILSLAAIGFKKTDMSFKGPELSPSLIQRYAQDRDYPSRQGSSGMGMPLRFGTISVRQCVAFAVVHSDTWLNELIWREFFMQILYHFPQVTTRAFKPKYDLIHWRNDEQEFLLWCKGQTGYPLVDAGMRQLQQTGFMHNRVRMVAASFLCKHLLIDWRWGEAYFAEKLNDYELASNNGNWQWAAGSGCDAAPYFRIFNPETQLKKFDDAKSYVKKWIPDYSEAHYLPPMVDHAYARQRALSYYQAALR